MDEVVLRGHRRARAALALGIVAGGVVLAWLIGRPDSLPKGDAPDAGDQVVLRRRATPQALTMASEPRAALNGEPAVVAAPAPAFRVSAGATVAMQGVKPDVMPPTLAPSFPVVDVTASARWGVSMGIGVPGAGIVEQSIRTHKIANGDSLPALAKRYFGSEDCADEIFRANRDLLTSPDALPIGVELRIPPRNAAAKFKPAPASPELVPIAPRGARSQKKADEGAS